MPILVVWAWPAIQIKLEIGADPNTLRQALVVKCSAGLVGRAEGVIELLQAAVNGDGSGGPDFELRIAHVKAEISGIIGDVPAIGEDG